MNDLQSPSRDRDRRSGAAPRTRDASGLDRRTFLRICTLAAAAVGLPASAGRAFAAALTQGRRPSVIWLSFQECTGCTESLLRTSQPGLDELVLDLISLDYHEALMAASGHQAEQARRKAMEENKGKFILVTEGATPLKDGGAYCKIGGRNAVDILRETADMAGAIVAIGSCASFGGIPAASPNLSGATGTPMVLSGRSVVTIPGCPPNAYNFLGTVLQYATFGSLPALDEVGRPKWAYERTIHEHCPRRAHFDAGRFATRFGDDGHRLGHCLYKLGCKGPVTHANCSVQSFGEVVDAWPIGIGHPCIGCTEQAVLWHIPAFTTVEIARPTPPDTYAPVHAEKNLVSPVATAVGGAVVGAGLGAAWMATKKLETPPDENPD